MLRFNSLALKPCISDIKFNAPVYKAIGLRFARVAKTIERFIVADDAITSRVGEEETLGHFKCTDAISLVAEPSSILLLLQINAW